MAANSEPVDEALDQAVEKIKEAIQLSMEDIKGDRQKEQEYIDQWVKYGTEISRFFMDEAERTGNQRITETLRKSVMKNVNVFRMIPKFWGG